MQHEELLRTYADITIIVYLCSLELLPPCAAALLRCQVWLRVCDECKQPCARSVDSCVPAVVLHCCRTLCCQVWLEVYEECKLLAEVERLRRDADAALHRLHDAKKKVCDWLHASAAPRVHVCRSRIANRWMLWTQRWWQM